jgi:hypothetical protein
MSGQYLAACTYGHDSSYNGLGYVYTSSSYGVSWTRTSSPRGSTNAGSWTSITSSSDGSILAVTQSGGGMGPNWRSSDFGVSWTQSTSTSDYYADTASDYSGNKIVAVSTCSFNHGGYINLGSYSASGSYIHTYVHVVKLIIIYRFE